MLVVQSSVQPGSSKDLATQLLEKRPIITVDRNGGLFLLSIGLQGAHPLVSGEDWGPNRPFGEHVEPHPVWHRSTNSPVYSQRNRTRSNE